MKTIEQIYADMMDVYFDKTGYDMSDSADLAVRFMAAAAEINSLYINADWVLRQAFPQTAVGIYLDYHAQARGLSRLSSSFAEGYLRFYLSSANEDDIIISKGTVCMTSSLISFETTMDGVISAGSLYTDIHAAAQTAGEIGNVKAGSVTYMSLPPVGVSGCTNNEAFIGGENGESDEQLRQRILGTYVRIPNGANAAYYANVAMAIEGVEAVSIIPRAEGVGTVGVVVAVMPGYTTADVLKSVYEDLHAKREIAVDVIVSEPTAYPVDIEIGVKLSDGYSWHPVKGAVENAVYEMFDGKLLGKAFLRAALGKAIYAVPGVENYAIVTPASDIEADAYRLPQLKSLSVSEMGA